MEEFRTEEEPREADERGLSGSVFSVVGYYSFLIFYLNVMGKIFIA